MNLMPELLAESRDGNAIHLHLKVPLDLAHFTGHFPGLPILPGVVQVDWAVRLARQYFPGLELSRGVDQLKFQAMVRPGAELHLTLGYEQERQRLQFIYRDGERICSSGRIGFEATS